jgi:hypothetical protein
MFKYLSQIITHLNVQKISVQWVDLSKQYNFDSNVENKFFILILMLNILLFP